jgi:sulfoxide reductase heme-binding subunit YedZ
MALWHTKRGDFSSLRAITLALLLTPALAALYYTATNNWGPRPFDAVTHFSGLWGVRILVATLLVTPFRRLGRWPKLIDVRRMMGVASFCYLVFHVSLYVVDQAFDIVTVLTEIALRIYLTIGFVAFIGMAALAITSNDYMVRRLGGMRWRKLHWLMHPIVILGVIHYFLQAKLEMFQPTVMAGIVGWAFAYRLAHWKLPRSFKGPYGELPLWFIGLLGLTVTALTFLIEAVGIGIGFGISPLLVLEQDFSFEAGIRPGWYVLAAGVIFFLVAAIRQRPGERKAELAPAE